MLGDGSHGSRRSAGDVHLLVSTSSGFWSFRGHIRSSSSSRRAKAGLALFGKCTRSTQPC